MTVARLEASVTTHELAEWLEFHRDRNEKMKAAAEGAKGGSGSDGFKQGTVANRRKSSGMGSRK